MNFEKNKRVSSQRKLKNSQTAGTVYSNVSSGATVYGEEKFHAVRGHGFAAERANTLYDRYTGHDARILGDDNAKNGADRLKSNRNIVKPVVNAFLNASKMVNSDT